MATEEQLVEAVKESLDRDGILAKLKAEVRCEVMSVLGICGMQQAKKPDVPTEIKLINELIKEYLAWAGYSYTSCVMAAESSSYPPVSPLTRQQIETELGLTVSGDVAIPLLYTLISQLRKKEGDV